MYTQCPECNEAFQPSAGVLKQASGHVRCGGCGKAFNALEHLSEKLPKSAARREAGAQIPELTAESGGSASAADEMRFDDNTPLPDDFDLGVESEQISTQVPLAAVPSKADDDSSSTQADLAFGDPGEWEELLGEVEKSSTDSTNDEPEDDRWADLEAEEKEKNALDAESEAKDDASEVAAAETAEAPPDTDTQFAIQAEAMGIDLSGIHETGEEEQSDSGTGDEKEDEVEESSDTSIDEDLIAAAFQSEAADKQQEEIEAEEKAEADEDKAEVAAKEDVKDEFTIPEMTEEEMTLDRMIDQELLNVAVEDEDGVVSTMIQRQLTIEVDEKTDDDGKAEEPEAPVEPEKPEEPEEPEEPKEPKEPEQLDEPDEPVEDTPLFETIIMEGDVVHAEKPALSRRSDDPGPVRDHLPPASAAVRGGQRRSDPPSIGLISGSIALTLLLVVQVAHQSREALATIPAFNEAVGPIYRKFGRPLTPAWDISGWRFEATKGSADNGDEVLTIYSRVGNTSDDSLPYPLVHVSLTDRFEEIIGSRVLEPGDYLDSDADPRIAVASGSTFNAVIVIESPAPEATGFKLDVCYRLASGQLSCAIEDFK